MADSAPSPVGAAFGWAARIMAVGLTMVLPGIGGRWLDSRLGTGFCEPAGFVLGFTAGLTCSSPRSSWRLAFFSSGSLVEFHRCSARKLSRPSAVLW
jgi:hypothetical protein